MQQTFKQALGKVEIFVQDFGFVLKYDDSNLDPFFKGDLDGKYIWLSPELDDEEKLFNLLHLVGHCIQWCEDENKFHLGSQLWKNPSERKLYKLYAYEWEANCYGLFLLEYLGYKSLKVWLYEMFKEDINYLMRFYRTGEKVKILPEDRVPSIELIPKPLPDLHPFSRPKSRQGIVI